MGYVMATIAASFFVLWLFNLRLRAFEAGNVGTWWHQWRIAHSITYLIAAVMLLRENRSAWIPLALDLVLALVARHVSKPTV